jgi:acyl carrier protein
MRDWVWWVSSAVCGALVVAQILGVITCLFRLRRTWRSAPELWSLDWLDIVYRIESEFGVVLAAADFEALPPTARAELTAGQLWEVVAAKLATAGTSEPADGWQRVVAILSQSLNVPSERITPSARLYADLGMMYGLD